ncbi:MAG: hypothetical protein AAFZ05_02690 [Pseudomonadota bacterium]
MLRGFLTVGLIASPFALSGPALAETVNTGGTTGAYHQYFCPALKKALSSRNYQLACEPSDGTLDNLNRVQSEPATFGYGQADVLALQVGNRGNAEAITRVRSDDVRECVFAVTKNRDLQNFGEIAVFAGQLNFFLPPEKSGSTGTFRFLQKIDPEGLGAAENVNVEATTDDAIRKAIETPGGVALFVQFPDPKNPRFKMIEDLGGHIVPVVDRAMLTQEVNGQKIYFAQETQVTNAKWLSAGRTVVTACVPLVLFAGNARTINDRTERQNHEDLVSVIRGLRTEDVLPQQSIFSKILRRTKQLSAAGSERLIKLSEKARERAKPLLDQAKATGRKIYERAKDGAETMIEKAKPKQTGESGN